MIRLLEISQREILQAWVLEQAWIFKKASKVDAGINTAPGQERVNPQSTLVKDEAVAAAYLRAAQAYMLISMPTGTSTIFGVFQAILALLVKPDELRPTQQGNTDRKVRQRNLYPKVPPPVLCCTATVIHGLVRVRVKPMMDQWVHIPRPKDADGGPTRGGEFQIEK